MLDRIAPERCLIMIAGKDKRIKAADSLDTFVWSRAVPDNVAQTPDGIIGRRGAQYRLEGNDVRMNVG
jgi:hypothetical protein